MFFSTTILLAVSAMAAVVAGSPVPEKANATLAKREISLGNPDLVVDQGNQYKLNFGSTEGHPNACPGHFICYISKLGNPPAHADVSLGDPDDMVDEGNDYRLNYGSTSGHPNACDGHFICYIPK